MGRIWMPGGGGGADLDVITAAADDVLKGKVIVDQDGNPLTGSLELTGNIGAADIRKGKKGYSTDPKKIITGTMAEQAAQTIMPGTANKTIAANRYLTGTQTILGDKNLIGANIIKGKTIFGVKGTAIYAGDTPGYFLEPPNEYTSLTGGWGLELGTYNEAEITKPSAEIYHWYNKSTMGDNSVGSTFKTLNKKMANKYRYVYFDYKNLNVKWNGSVNPSWTTELLFLAFGAATSMDIGSNITNKSGTVKLLVEQGSDTGSIYIKIDLDGNSYWNESRTVTINLDIVAIRYDEIQ